MSTSERKLAARFLDKYVLGKWWTVLFGGDRVVLFVINRGPESVEWKNVILKIVKSACQSDWKEYGNNGPRTLLVYCG